MTEVELKLQVPPAAAERVRAAVMRGRWQATPLAAAYADTADDRLAAHAFALRLRREGERWVQTLKGRGDGLMQRLEHEVPLPAARTRPRLDPARHAGTPAGDALAHLLADGAALAVRYRTDIRRTHRLLKTGGAEVEIAFDEGWIVAGRRRLAVCELEFELKAGPPAALVALAMRWTRRFGLRLDVRTKSERGHRLALGQAHGPARPAVPARAAGRRARLHAALSHLLPNAAELADGNPDPAVEQEFRQALSNLRLLLKGQAPGLTQAFAQPFNPMAVSGTSFTLAVLQAMALTLAPGKC